MYEMLEDFYKAFVAKQVGRGGRFAESTPVGRAGLSLLKPARISPPLELSTDISAF